MVDRDQERTVWRSFCIESDRQATVYFGQLAVSFAVLGFCAVMLLKADGDCSQSSPYVGLISFILGKALSSVVDSSKS